LVTLTGDSWAVWLPVGSAHHAPLAQTSCGHPRRSRRRGCVRQGRGDRLLLVDRGALSARRRASLGARFDVPGAGRRQHLVTPKGESPDLRPTIPRQRDADLGGSLLRWGAHPEFKVAAAGYGGGDVALEITASAARPGGDGACRRARQGRARNRLLL